MSGSQTTDEAKTFGLNEQISGWGYLAFGSGDFCRQSLPIDGLGNTQSFNGVKRKLTNYYAPRPLHIGGDADSAIPEWYVVENGDGPLPTYFMPLPVADEFQFSNLYELAKSLRAQHVGKPVEASIDGQPNPALAELDWLADKLLIATEAVHAAGRRLGQIDPRSILYYYDAHDRCRLALPDLPFDYTGPPAPQPEWKQRQDFMFLWRDSVDDRRTLVDFQKSPATPEQDVRTLARLFSWILTGNEQIPEPRNREPAVWPVLRQAAAAPNGTSAIRKVSDLQSQLLVQGSRLSDHFRARPLSDASAGRGILSVLVAALLIAAFVGAGVIFKDSIPIPPAPEPKYIHCPDCPGESAVARELRTSQTPLVTAFHAQYGYGPGDRAGRKVTGTIIRSQLENLTSQLSVLESLVGPQSEPRTPAEQKCLETEIRRLRDALGMHWQVLYEFWQKDKPPNITAPDGDFARFRDYFIRFRMLPLNPQLEQAQWYAGCKYALEMEIGFSLSSKSSP